MHIRYFNPVASKYLFYAATLMLILIKPSANYVLVFPVTVHVGRECTGSINANILIPHDSLAHKSMIMMVLVIGVGNIIVDLRRNHWKCVYQRSL